VSESRLTKQQLLEFMQTQLQLDVSDVTEETRLFSDSLLDSLAMVEVIAFVEKAANVRFDPQDVTLENLDSIGRIMAFVQSAG